MKSIRILQKVYHVFTWYICRPLVILAMVFFALASIIFPG